MGPVFFQEVLFFDFLEESAPAFITPRARAWERRGGVLQKADWAYLGKKEIGKRISEKNNRPNLPFAELHEELRNEIFPSRSSLISALQNSTPRSEIPNEGGRQPGRKTFRPGVAAAPGRRRTG
jgi:hypothetical protein